MALNPKISRSATASVWELGWQDSIENDVIPTAGADFDYMDVWQGMQLWIESHCWAADCEEGGRSDMVAALANVGPAGVWQSMWSTITEMVSRRPPIIMLGDLRISKHSVTSLKSSLGFRFPQYHVVVSSHSASEWETTEHGRMRRKYHYALATLFHRTLFSNIATKTIHDPRNPTERAAVLGHALVNTATAKSIGKSIMVVNIYQHTSAFPTRQMVLWGCLERFLEKQEWSDTHLIGGGDLNAAFAGQREDYKSTAHVRSDKILQEVSETKHIEFVGPDKVTYWNPTGASRATLDHVFVSQQQVARAMVTVRPSWNPAHDHANLYVFARIGYLPGRPAVGPYRPPQRRVCIKTFDRRKCEWGVISDDVMVGLDSDADYKLSPDEFQHRFHGVIEQVIDAGVNMVGLTSGGTNRPPYRTAEISELIRRSRMLTSAKRDFYSMTIASKSFTRSQILALEDLALPIPKLPITVMILDSVRAEIREANSSLLMEIKEKTTSMERQNIRDRLEQLREDLGKARFSVQTALGKMMSPGVLDIIEQRVPVGLLFDLDAQTLTSILIDGNLEQAACWIESVKEGQMSVIRAPNIENVVPLLTRAPAYVRPKELVWGVLSVREDQHCLWIMDHHYQQISYAKNSRCGGCKSKTPVALSLRLNGELVVVDYCSTCFGVHPFAADPDEYEDLSFLGGVMDYRRVGDGESIAGELPFDIFMKYIGRLKERKAAGLDRFHVEFLKHAATSVQKYVHHLVNLILTKQVQIEEDFLVGEIRLLFKKEPAHNLRNWRPVCLLQMVYKLVSLVINDRLSVMVEKYHLLEDSQEGFRRSRGTGRQAQSLVWIYQRAARKGLKLYSVMTDFVSAFDSADHPALLRTLRAYNIPDTDLIASLYRASPFRVTTSFGTTSKIRVGRGCRQGDILSPLAFDLFVNILLRYVNATGVGAYITDDRKVNHKAFADDISFITHSFTDMQTLLGRMERFCLWSGMEVNMLKTKATAIDYSTGDVPIDLGVIFTAAAAQPSNVRSKPRAVCNLTFEGDKIDFVPPQEPMTYLGYDLTLTGSWKAEIEKVKSKTARLATILHRHKFTEGQGRYLFQCSAVSTFRYSVGVAQWTEKDLRALTYLWARAYKNANHLASSVARSLILFPTDMGGEQLQSPFPVALKEVGAHLQRCLNYDDNISEQLWVEAHSSLQQTMCADLTDLQSEAAHLDSSLQSNIFIRWSFLANFCGVDLEWTRMPKLVTGMSWAEVLRPIRSKDVQWSQDEATLRRAARQLWDAGERDVLSLPFWDGELHVPRMRGLQERHRARLEQWVGSTVSVLRENQDPTKLKESARSTRTRLETIEAVSNIVDTTVDFTRGAVEDVIDSIRVVMEENENWMQDVMTALESKKLTSWTNIVDLTRQTLLPNTPTYSIPRVRTTETSEWHQMVRYSQLLYTRVTGIKKHFSGKGWKLRCVLSGRTRQEIETLLSLSDRVLCDTIIREQRAILLPADWWSDLTPPTPWGWWVLPVESKGGGVLVRSMERAAISDPITYLSLRGLCSIVEALSYEISETALERWVSIEDLGFTFGLASKPGRPRRCDDEDLPVQLHRFLRERGPLLDTELLPTPGVRQNWRGLRGAVHVRDRKPRTLVRQIVSDDHLTDETVINDTNLLLQYHLRRFREARYVPLSKIVTPPKEIRSAPGKVGVNVETHSFMDMAPPRLDGNLIKVTSHSIRYEETIGELTGRSYQGVTHVSDGARKWELDGMRWHQIWKDELITKGSDLQDHVTAIQAAEKRGYRSLTWIAMQEITTRFGLTRSYGEPLLGSYPGLNPLTRLEETASAMEPGRGWLFIDSVPPDKASQWLQKMIDGGGGIVAATTRYNMRKETSQLLRTSARAHQVATIPTGALRVKGWWQTGGTKTAKRRQKNYLWLILPRSESPAFSNLKRWLESALPSQLYPVATSGRGRSYWTGSEAGRLGLYEGQVTLLASDGSAGETTLGAGFTLRMGGEITDWNASVDGGDEQITSFRPEAAGLGAGARIVPPDEPLAMLVDNESLLKVVEAWIGSSHHPSPLATSDFDLVSDLIASLQRRTAPTFLFKVKSHRGEPFNTRADTLADRGVHNITTTVERTAGARIRYRVDGYFGVWCSKVQRHAEARAAQRISTRPELSKGVLDKFLHRKDMGRQFLGDWLKRRSKRSDKDHRCALQIISDTFPTPSNLHRWGLKPTPICDECGFEWGSLGHIQGHCAATKEARIACHNRCREIVTDVIRNSKTGWKTYPETTCADTLLLFHNITGISLPSMPDTSFWDPKLEEWRTLRWEEARHFRVDELAINSVRQCLWYNEMTRAWDRSENFEQKKDNFKTSWYKPWIEHLNTPLAQHGWMVRQLNLTVGARASIPLYQWSSCLNLYDVKPKHQLEAYQKLADALMDGTLEIIQAYKSHRFSRIEQIAIKKPPTKG